MKTNRTTILLAAALVAAVLPILPSAAAEDEVAPLPPACEAALSATRDQLIAQQGIITMPEAVALLQSNAGEVCGFDVYVGDVGGIDQRALGNFLQIGTPTGIKVDGGDGGGQGVPNLLGRGNVVRCTKPGVGGGSLDAYVLGVQIPTPIAEGQWKPVSGGLVEVTGEAGSVGGTQAGERGVMRVLGAAVPALKESSEAYCLETETTVEETCWNFVVYRHCETVTQIALALCGASAKQSLFDLVRFEHNYEVEDAPEGCS